MVHRGRRNTQNKAFGATTIAWEVLTGGGFAYMSRGAEASRLLLNSGLVRVLNFGFDGGPEQTPGHGTRLGFLG